VSAQLRSAEVDSDVDELAAEADFDDGFCERVVERLACDDALDFAGLDVTLTLLDLLREDDVLKRCTRSSPACTASKYSVNAVCDAAAPKFSSANQ
jgi:hypothetical protein